MTTILQLPVIWCILFNPHTYMQTYTPTMVRVGWLQPLPWVLLVLQYIGNILPQIDSLSCALQDQVNIMGYGTARGL